MDAAGLRLLRQELVNNLIARQAHMTFEDAVDHFPAEAVNLKPAGLQYSFWHLIEHIRICQKDLLDYMVAADYTAPHFPDDLWPDTAATTDAAGWGRSLQGFYADRQAMVDLIQDDTFDLFAPINRGWQGHNMLREVLITADHNAYHVGEFAVLRGLAGLWAEADKVL